MSTHFKVGSWSVYPDSNKLRFDNTDYFIEPLAMDVLVYFAQHREQVMSRDRLIDVVWKGRIVGDHAVYRIINKLRQTLAMDTSQEYIKTIRKKGYQLVCEVSGEQLIKSELSESAPSETESFGVVFSQESSSAEHFTTERSTDESEITSPKDAKPKLGKKRKSYWKQGTKWLFLGVVILIIGLFALKFYFYHSMTTYYQSIPLIMLDGTIRDPSFSPDGNYIAFSYQDSTGDNWDIYVESLVDGRLYQITDDVTDELSPSWAPDGNKVAILRFDNQSCVIDVIAVPLASPSEQEGTSLVKCSGFLQHNDLVWGIGGKYLYYTSARTKVSPLQIFRLTIQTGKTEQLTNYTQGETRGALGIKLSPDSETLAVLRDVNWRDSSIDLLDLGTLKTKTVRRLVGWNRYFDWTKDGQSLIYNRNSKEIDAYNLSMNIEKNIAKSVEAISFPASSPTKSELAVVTGHKVVNIVAETLGAHPNPKQKPLTIISSSSIDNYAEYANTSDNIAFVSRRTGEPQIWLKSIGGSEKQLTHFQKNYDIRRIRWSPDDQFLLFIHNKTLYRLSLDEQALTSLYQAQNGESIEGESWSHSGDSILFSSDRDGDWQVYQLPLGGVGKVTQLTTRGGYGAFESPQKSGIFYLKYHAKGLWYQDYDSAEEMMVVDNVDVFSWNSIYIRQNNLYYLSDDFPRMTIYRYDLEERLRYFVQNYYGSPWLLSISYQADKLLYQRNTQSQSSLVLLKP